VNEPTHKAVCPVPILPYSVRYNKRLPG